jgi:hypothetical protein
LAEVKANPNREKNYYTELGCWRATQGGCEHPGRDPKFFLQDREGVSSTLPAFIEGMGNAEPTDVSVWPYASGNISAVSTQRRNVQRLVLKAVHFRYAQTPACGATRLHLGVPLIDSMLTSYARRLSISS